MTRTSFFQDLQSASVDIVVIVITRLFFQRVFEAFEILIGDRANELVGFTVKKLITHLNTPSFNCAVRHKIVRFSVFSPLY